MSGTFDVVYYPDPTARNRCAPQTSYVRYPEFRRTSEVLRRTTRTGALKSCCTMRCRKERDVRRHPRREWATLLSGSWTLAARPRGLLLWGWSSPCHTAGWASPGRRR
jgi:hypothetical protein